MTEKRFRVHELVKYNYSEIGEYIDENHTDRPLRNDILVELLNELYEENQDLKSFNKDLAENLSVCANARISKDNRIERLEEKIQRERTSFTKTHERWSKEAETKIKELSEENEQLKIQLQNTSEQRDEFHRGARENANRVGKLEKENERLKEENNKLHQKIFEMRTNIALERTEISRQTYTGKKNEKEYSDAKEFLDELEKW